MTENAKLLLQEIRQCDGAEIHEDFWTAAQELVDAGLIHLGFARGPSRAWKRGTLKED